MSSLEDGHKKYRELMKKLGIESRILGLVSFRHQPTEVPDLASPIEAAEPSGTIPLERLRLVPGLLTNTWTLPTPEWPVFRGASRETTLDVALVLAFFDAVPVRLLKEPSWLLLGHQINGHWCGHVSMAAIRLQPCPKIQEAFRELARRWWYIGNGWGPSPPDIEGYCDTLASLGLDYTGEPDWICEAFYPIDASQRALDKIALNPPDLLRLTGRETLQTCRNVKDGGLQAALVFLAPNSD